MFGKLLFFLGLCLLAAAVFTAATGRTEAVREIGVKALKSTYEYVGQMDFAPREQTVRAVRRDTMYREPRASERPTRIYVREYSNFKPSNGAPIFYAPFPDTLCMLGETSEGPGVIYEATEGACTDVILKWVMTYHQSQESS